MTAVQARVILYRRSFRVTSKILSDARRYKYVVTSTCALYIQMPFLICVGVKCSGFFFFFFLVFFLDGGRGGTPLALPASRRISLIGYRRSNE